MSLIQDISEAINLPNLTDNQKGTLISVHASATPQQSYEATNGTSNSIAARNDLIRMGMLQQNGNQVILTQKGNAALLSNNLVDNTGQITEEGETQLDNFKSNKSEYTNLESFDMFRSFYQ
jgi:hypothetical protein